MHIVGIVGLPARYGGFETLVDNLLDSPSFSSAGTVVYCDPSAKQSKRSGYKGATLETLRWRANGWQSVLYDSEGMLRASLADDRVLILGTSATALLPFLRLLFPKVRYAVNIGGLEWKRSKWGPVARRLLKLNERMAAKFAHSLIADNQGLVDYLRETYGVGAVFIPYGGDHYLSHEPDDAVFDEWRVPRSGYDFAVARAQPDNNLELILDAYADVGSPLVFVSNWDSSDFGKRVRERYRRRENLHLVGPIYSAPKMRALHRGARLYVHGHSAGGTNPALVEAMWAGLPILAFDVNFNRYTTGGRAEYFSSRGELAAALGRLDEDSLARMGRELEGLARRQYTWASVQKSYSSLFEGTNSNGDRG
jgi:glycosyltransferase involved in cell wall biosynthesis